MGSETVAHRGFRAPWWCRGPHCQTLWSVCCRRQPQPELIRERLELADGDFIDLDWTDNELATAPLVVILHGLEGSSRSHYATGLLTAIRRHGWRGVVMHFRGCSGEPNRLARAYHSGEINDLGTVIDILQQRQPSIPVAVVGYSLGGNVLLNWLAQRRDHGPMVAAVAISVPFELAECVDRLNRGMSKIYQRHLLTNLLDSIHSKARRVDLPIDLSVLDNIRTIREFDDRVIAPLHGFRDADDYYRQSSSRQHLHAIDIDTLIIQARDDPFMTAAVNPEVTELSPAITLEVSNGGGHVGFVYGSWPWRAQYWLETRIPAFLEPRLRYPLTTDQAVQRK